MKPTRLTILLGLLSLAACLAALSSGALPVGPQRAVAAEGEDETPTTPTEPPTVEVPPVVETPTKLPAPPVETPVTTPPATEAPSSGSTGTTSTPSESKSPSSSSGSTGTSSGGGGGSTGTTTTGTTATAPSSGGHRTSHVRTTPAKSTGGKGSTGSTGSKGSSGGSGGSTNAGGSPQTGGGGNSPSSHVRHHSTGSSGSAAAPQPSFSPQEFDEGATAVTTVASHVGEVFAKTIPTAPLKKIGDRLAAHIGLAQQKGVQGGGKDSGRIGTALGAALIGSAVAVQRPAPRQSPIPFLGSPTGGNESIYLILLAAVLLLVAVFIVRELRKALGLTMPKPSSSPPAQPQRFARRPSRPGAGDWAVGIMARARDAGELSLRTFRRVSASAVSGVRSLF